MLTFLERHYSYECKASTQERPYASRPSRSQQLRNPKLVPKLTNDTLNPLEQKYVKALVKETYCSRFYLLRLTDHLGKAWLMNSLPRGKQRELESEHSRKRMTSSSAMMPRDADLLPWNLLLPLLTRGE